MTCAVWRCRSRDNLSSVDEVFADCAMPAQLGPHHCRDPDPFRTVGRTFVDFLSHPVLSASGRGLSMVLSHFFDKLSVCAPMIIAAIMRRGFICTSLTGATMEPSGSLQREHSPHRASHEFWKSCVQTSHLRGIERPLAFDEIHVFFITKGLFNAFVTCFVPS